jgi:quinol-cytochrome oxidoreductase complex cytochrome b subunit
MNNKYDFLAGIFYILFMLFTIIIGICGIIFGPHRPDLNLLAIFLIVAPTIDLTRRFTIAWIYVNMEEENEDNDEIK